MHKGLLFIVFLFLIPPVGAGAQGLEIEFTVGPTITSLRGYELLEDNLDAVTNLVVGTELNYSFSNRTFLSAGLLFDRKGGGNEFVLNLGPDPSSGTGSVTFRNTFNYLSLPIQFGKEFGDKIRFEFSGGIYTAFLLSQEETIDSNSMGSTEENYKSLDFGLAGSFAARYYLKENFFLKLGIHDYLGLTNVSAVSIPNDGAIKHNSFGVALSAGFKLK